jgi:hypothetical protein
MEFAGYYYTMRLYCYKTTEKWLSFDDAEALLTSKYVPERLTHMSEHTSIPENEELEDASIRLFGDTSDE